MLLNFKVLAFFWRQFYQEIRKRVMKSSSFNRLFGFSPTTTKSLKYSEFAVHVHIQV